uniref:Transmembrane protein 106A n=1 Tax=Takifugu rubripes TaxID=31033 RepID=A0A3B5JUS2_TAKRU
MVLSGCKELEPGMDKEKEKEKEKEKALKHFPPYGSINGTCASDTCPTCRGTGRIPRDHEDQLVAVIPCNDVRLKPRRTKLYVLISMALCLLVCCLVLFFLFPRSITLTPVSVLSVMVYFRPDSVDLQVTNLINITNENFVPVNIVDFSIQGVISKAVIGKTKISNLGAIQSRSQSSRVLQVQHHQDSHPVPGTADDHERLLSLPHGAAVGRRLRVRRLWHQLNHPASGELTGIRRRSGEKNSENVCLLVRVVFLSLGAFDRYSGRMEKCRWVLW